MLGKFTSDPIEKEFGKLRQGSGGTYFITVQQMLKRLPLLKQIFYYVWMLIMIFLILKQVILVVNVAFFYQKTCVQNLITFLSLESSLSVDTIMTLVYIAGYVVRNDDDVDDTYFYWKNMEVLPMKWIVVA